MTIDSDRELSRLRQRVIELEAVCHLAHRALLGKGLHDRAKAMAAIEGAVPSLREKA